MLTDIGPNACFYGALLGIDGERRITARSLYWLYKRFISDGSIFYFAIDYGGFNVYTTTIQSTTT